MKKCFDKNKKYTPWYAWFDGQRKFFKTEGELDTAIEKHIGDPEAEFSAREKETLRRCKQMLPPGTNWMHVTTFFLQNAPEAKSILVKDAVAHYLEHRLKSKTMRPRYRENIERFCGYIVERFGEKMVRAVKSSEIEEWCLEEKSPYTQQTKLAQITMFFSYCVRREWVIDHPSLSPKVKVESTRGVASRDFFPLDEIQKIVNALATPYGKRIRAGLAIQLFTGLRTEEVKRLRWEDIKMGEFINVRAEVAKTGERRVIDWWSPALTHCIGEVKKSGPVVPVTYDRSRRRLYKRVGVRRVTNGTRHSFATYTVAMFQDAKRVSLILGHRSSDTLFTNYRNYATQAEGEKYHAMTPGTPV
jgi:integrase